MGGWVGVGVGVLAHLKVLELLILHAHAHALLCVSSCCAMYGGSSVLIDTALGAAVC